MTPDDVTVEITDDAITLSGQRKQEKVEENGGVYRLERSYGAFYREIPLPEGAIANRATASFKDACQITVPRAARTGVPRTPRRDHQVTA